MTVTERWRATLEHLIGCRLDEHTAEVVCSMTQTQLAAVETVLRLAIDHERLLAEAAR